MGLPGHRRTKSHKRRRASHFAITTPTLTKDTKTGSPHRPHRAAPGATEYNGIKIHVKGQEKKLRKLLEKTKPQATKAEKKKEGTDAKAKTEKTKAASQ